MSRASAVQASKMVSRSMRISRATHLAVATLAAAISLNVMVAVQFIGILGQAVLLAAVFCAVSVALTSISSDIYSRSSEAVSHLRSIGATSKSISKALALSMLTYGGGGALIGALAGAGFGEAFGTSGAGALALIVELTAVLITCAGSVAVGAYWGARVSWHN